MHSHCHCRQSKTFAIFRLLPIFHFLIFAFVGIESLIEGNKVHNTWRKESQIDEILLKALDSCIHDGIFFFYSPFAPVQFN